jgi:protoporphyrin/coproporphyrin ferrochelatase
MTDAAPAKPAVILVNLGTPAAPTRAAVKQYLSQFLHDHRVVDLTRWLWCPLLHFIILPIRSGRVAKKYAQVWMKEGSPLRVLSERLTQRVQAELPEYDVRLAMTYGEPSIASVLNELREKNASQVIVLPLYPQYSGTTTEAVFDAVSRAEKAASRPLSVERIKEYYQHPEWLRAMADSIQAHWQKNGRAETLVMSFHGIPQRYARNGDPYPKQCEASAQSIAQLLGLNENQWMLTYQSRFGREPWLQPYTDHSLEALAKSGVKTVDIVCPGFAADCLETLEEIRMENAHIFQQAGGTEFRYIECLNDSEAHAKALASVVRGA